MKHSFCNHENISQHSLNQTKPQKQLKNKNNFPIDLAKTQWEKTTTANKHTPIQVKQPTINAEIGEESWQKKPFFLEEQAKVKKQDKRKGIRQEGGNLFKYENPLKVMV